MKTSNSQIEHLKLMLSLEEKRAGLQQGLDALDSQLADLKRRLVSGAPALAPKAAPVAKTPSKARKPAKAKHGALKDKIFALLEKAGAAGVKVLDVAKAVQTEPANIYAWFHAAVKRYPVIKKTGAAQYKLTSKQKTPAASAAPKAAAAPKAPKAKPAKAKGKTNKRGALQARILEALKSAGSGGTNIKALAAKFKMPYRNVQVWFATTGKKNPAVKKIGPATYQFAG
jgi:hypothetical protein